MKSASDPRHIQRRELVKELFAFSFSKQDISEKTREILDSLDKNKIDKRISEALDTWPIDKVNKIDLAILRLAVYELHLGSAPPKVVIDEAIELAKEFGSESTPSFVNGVLGKIISEVK